MALVRPHPGQGMPMAAWIGQIHMWSPNRVAQTIRTADPMSKDAVLRSSIMGASRGVKNWLHMRAIDRPAPPSDANSLPNNDIFLHHFSALAVFIGIYPWSPLRKIKETSVTKR